MAMIAIAAVSVTWFARRPKPVIPAASDARLAQSVPEEDLLRAQVAALRQSLSQETAAIESLKNEHAASSEVQHNVQAKLDDARIKIAQLSADLQTAESEKSELAHDSQAQNAVIANLRAQDEALSRERSEMLSSTVLLEAQVHNLTASLEEKSATLERERQLTAATKEVRQLMGARNLHILDVQDVVGGSDDAKAFGRVFYAEGQSLVFYAFDLPSQGRNPAKYTFQAWGQREPGAQSVRNLGTFEVDDHDQHRWVLTVNDPALLAGIDSVFVTSESLRDSKEPRGHKVMYAYLGGQPNHP
jgi:hypothetical protein